MIRLATSSDVDAIVTLGQSSLLSTPDKDRINNACSQSPVPILVFVDKQQIAGFLHYQLIGDECEIIDIAVAESCRRQGVATALMEHLQNEFPAIKKIYLEVSANNTNAQAFYKKLGFKQIAVRKGYYRDGSDALILNLCIPT